jgi:hypothetical protein
MLPKSSIMPGTNGAPIPILSGDTTIPTVLAALAGGKNKNFRDLRIVARLAVALFSGHAAAADQAAYC